MLPEILSKLKNRVYKVVAEYSTQSKDAVVDFRPIFPVIAFSVISDRDSKDLNWLTEANVAVDGVVYFCKKAYPNKINSLHILEGDELVLICKTK